MGCQPAADSPEATFSNALKEVVARPLSFGDSVGIVVGMMIDHRSLGARNEVTGVRLIHGTATVRKPKRQTVVGDDRDAYASVLTTPVA